MEIEKFLNSYTFGDILNKYPVKLKNKALNIITKNLELKNPECRKNKLTIEDVVRHLFANGLIELDRENKKIEAAIKLSRKEITEEEFMKIMNDLG